uniref:S1 motif domain-containing protein n=1 Tax=Lygus hesperus TaxID=30085 RepID=A0A0A9ZC67_LYGHE
MVADEEEEYFPRGGSSGKIATKKHFVFEKDNKTSKEPKKRLGKRERRKLKQQKGQKSNKDGDGESEDEGGADESFDDYEAANLDGAVQETRLKKLEPLSYHNLAEGMVTLCSVNTILSRSIKVSLPERLLCTIDFQDISTPLKEAESGDVNKIFRVGDIIACKIKSIKKRSGDSQVRATSDPAQINCDLDHNDIHVGSVFLGAVKSVEDHGYMIFSGISELNAFLPFNNVEGRKKNKKKEKKPLAVGKLVWCKVVKSTDSEGIKNVQVSTRTEDFDELQLSEDVISEKSLLPGMKFNLTVTKHVGRNLEVSIKGIDSQGFIPHYHLRSIACMANDFQIGAKLLGTVLYKYPISNVAAFSLRVGPTSQEKQVFETGEVFERAEIVSHDKRGLGVKFERDDNTCYGIISKRRMEGDLKGKQLEELFPKGNHLKVVIIGYHHIDQLYSCSTEDDLLSGKFLTMSQLREMVGKAVNVVVKEIKERGAVVMIDKRTAFVPANQVTDTVGSQPLKKLQVNSKHKGRILRVDPEKNAITVTLRPTLVNNKPLIDFMKTTKGDAYYGSITSTGDDKINVTFFNGLKTGILQENLILDSYKYKIGELVKCYVLREGNLKRSPRFSLVRHVDQMLLSIGETYKLIVKGTTQSGVECLLKEKNSVINAFIPLQLLCDDENLWERMRQTLSPGKTIDGHVFCFDSHLNPVLTLRESVKYYFREGGDRLRSHGFSALKNGIIMPVIIYEEVVDGFYVSVPVPKYNGKVLVPKEVIHRYGNVNVRDVLWLAVESVNLGDRKINFSYPTLEAHEKQLKRWAISNLRSYLTVVSSIMKYKPGDRVSAVATGVGNRCRLSDGKEAIIEDSDKSRKFSEEQKLDMMVLLEDPEKGTLHLTEWKDPPAADLSLPKKYATFFVSERFFVGRSTDGSICFCPTVFHPKSSESDADLRHFSREKALLIDLCQKDGNLLLGVPRKIRLRNPSVTEVEASQTMEISMNGKSKKKKKRNRSLSNKPIEHNKKAKLTLVSSGANSDNSRKRSKSRRKKMKRKHIKNQISSDSNSLSVTSEYKSLPGDSTETENPAKKLKIKKNRLTDFNPLLLTSEY